MVSWAWVVVIAIGSWYLGASQARATVEKETKEKIIDKLEHFGVDPTIIDEL